MFIRNGDFWSFFGVSVRMADLNQAEKAGFRRMAAAMKLL